MAGWFRACTGEKLADSGWAFEVVSAFRGRGDETVEVDCVGEGGRALVRGEGENEDEQSRGDVGLECHVGDVDGIVKLKMSSCVLGRSSLARRGTGGYRRVLSEGSVQ